LLLLSDAAQRVGTAQLVEAGCRRAAASAADPDLIGRVATLPDKWRPTARRARAVVELTGADLAVATHELSDDVVAAVTALATPSELLLALGADDRVIPCDGMNSYGFPIADVDPTALLSSCTASPPGSNDLAAVEQWRTAMLSDVLSSGHSPSPAQWRAPVAAGIAELLGLPDHDVRRLVLTPSGTDAETVAAAISVYSHGRPLVNVVVGARETGSGTLRAASGSYPSASTPLGETAAPGSPIDGLGPDLIRVVDVEVRDARGRARRPFDVEAEIEAHVEAARDEGATVLVHVLECSKTGLAYLEPGWVRAWRERYPANLRVVVDAAQTRTSAERLRAFLAAGASLIVTGSKALSGAPFSGVLVLDDALLADAHACDVMPAGLAASLSQTDLPAELARLGATWQPVNLGLLSRWHTGIEQRRRLSTLPAADRSHLTGTLLGLLGAGLTAIDGVDILGPTRPESAMLCFTISGPQGPLGREVLTRLHRALARDRVYLGQPAELVAAGAAALRVAVGDATLNLAVVATDTEAHLRDVAAATVDAVRQQARIGIDARA
jgi:hypothetical protein